MTQNENRDDLHEYGRRGRGIGLSIMLALLAVLVLGLFWFGTHGSHEISDERLTPQRQSMGAGKPRELELVPDRRCRTFALRLINPLRRLRRVSNKLDHTPPPVVRIAPASAAADISH